MTPCLLNLSTYTAPPMVGGWAQNDLAVDAPYNPKKQTNMMGRDQLMR